jgi:hypothetical protein
MQIIVPGTDLDDDSWKADTMRQWEQKWNRKLGQSAQSASAQGAKTSRKARRTA